MQMEIETKPEAPETTPAGPTDADLAELLNRPSPPNDDPDQAAALVRTINKLGDEILGHVHDVVNNVPGSPFEIDLGFGNLHSTKDFTSREKLCRVDVDLNLKMGMPPLFVNLTNISHSLSILLFKLSHEIEQLAYASAAMDLPEWTVSALMTMLPPRSSADAVEFDIVDSDGLTTHSVHGTEADAQGALDDDLKQRGYSIRHKGWSELSSRIHEDNRPMRLYPLAETKAGRQTLQKQIKARKPKPSPPIRWTATVNTPAGGEQEPRQITLYDLIDADGSILHERIKFEQIGTCLETYRSIHPGQPKPTVRAVTWCETFVPSPQPTASE